MIVDLCITTANTTTTTTTATRMKTTKMSIRIPATRTPCPWLLLLLRILFVAEAFTTSRTGHVVVAPSPRTATATATASKSTSPLFYSKMDISSTTTSTTTQLKLKLKLKPLTTTLNLEQLQLLPTRSPTRSSSSSQEEELQSLLHQVESYLSSSSSHTTQLLRQAYQFYQTHTTCTSTCTCTSASTCTSTSTSTSTITSNRRSSASAEESQSSSSSTHRPLHSNGMAVARIIADNMKLDVASIVAGLLHELVVNGQASITQISNRFGDDIGQLLQGLSTLDQIHPYSGQDSENYRKFLVVASKGNIRVILIQLAIQTQRVQSLLLQSQEEPSPPSSSSSSPSSGDTNHRHQHRHRHHKQLLLAQETLDVYAPLAHRLGIYRLKTQMEEACFQYLYPTQFHALRGRIQLAQQHRQAYTDKTIQLLQNHLLHSFTKKDNNNRMMPITVTGRPKSLYSVHQKMQSKQCSLGDIQDLMAFRVLVDNVEQCYQALKIVHGHYEPLPNRFKDYVRKPKPNGYQSIHTTVVGPEGKTMEVQIRTQEMHQVAESGIAAHWQYKRSSNTKVTSPPPPPLPIEHEEESLETEAKRFTWLRQLVDGVQQQPSNNNNNNSATTTTTTTSAHNNNDNAVALPDYFQKEVFCFTPQGQLICLPQGATILDFAYRIHSDLGNHCIGASIHNNGKSSSSKSSSSVNKPIDYILQNGNVVDILQAPHFQTPQREWLDYCITAKAKSKIKYHLKTTNVPQHPNTLLNVDSNNNIHRLGKELLDQHLLMTSATATAARRPLPSSSVSAFQERYRP